MRWKQWQSSGKVDVWQLKWMNHQILHFSRKDFNRKHNIKTKPLPHRQNKDNYKVSLSISLGTYRNLGFRTEEWLLVRCLAQSANDGWKKQVCKPRDGGFARWQMEDVSRWSNNRDRDFGIITLCTSHNIYWTNFPFGTSVHEIENNLRDSHFWLHREKISL